SARCARIERRPPDSDRRISRHLVSLLPHAIVAPRRVGEALSRRARPRRQRRCARGTCAAQAIARPALFAALRSRRGGGDAVRVDALPLAVRSRRRAPLGQLQRQLAIAAALRRRAASGDAPAMRNVMPMMRCDMERWMHWGISALVAATLVAG